MSANSIRSIGRINQINQIRTLQDLHLHAQDEKKAPTPAPLEAPKRALSAPNQGRGRLLHAVAAKPGKTSSSRGKRAIDAELDGGAPGMGRRRRQHKVVEAIPENEPGGSQLLSEKVRPRRLIDVQQEIKRLKREDRNLKRVYVETKSDAALAARRGVQDRLNLLMRLARTSAIAA